MLTPTGVFIEYDLRAVIAAFAEMANWEDLSLGEYNGKYDKEVSFKIEYHENDFFQHEQDYVVFVNFDADCCDITLENLKQRFDWKEYKGNRYLQLPFIVIVDFMRGQGILPKTALLFRN